MSDALSALSGATSAGYCTVAEAGLHGMLTLRGDQSDTVFRDAVAKATGHAMPGQRQIVHHDGGSLAWMSPDELLLVTSYDSAQELAETLRNSLAAQHCLVEVVSDARSVFDIKGTACREVLAKLAPVDLHASAFGPGDFRRTRLAQIPAAFWMPTPESFRVVCFRSVARYAFDLFSVSARQGGKVGYPEQV